MENGKRAEFWWITVVVKAYHLTTMAQNGEYDVPLYCPLVIWIINLGSMSQMYQKFPKTPNICHTKNSLTLMRNILTLEIHDKIFFLDYERSTQGLLISGQNLKIAVWQHQKFCPFRYDRKNIQSAISPKFINGNPKFFLATLRPLRDLQTTTQKIFFILLKMSTRAKSWFARWKTGRNFENSYLPHKGSLGPHIWGGEPWATYLQNDPKLERFRDFGTPTIGTPSRISTV